MLATDKLPFVSDHMPLWPPFGPDGRGQHSFRKRDFPCTLTAALGLGRLH
jgi:hypothetical protein